MVIVCGAISCFIRFLAKLYWNTKFKRKILQLISVRNKIIERLSFDRKYYCKSFEIISLNTLHNIFLTLTNTQRLKNSCVYIWTNTNWFERCKWSPRSEQRSFRLTRRSLWNHLWNIYNIACLNHFVMYLLLYERNCVQSKKKKFNFRRKNQWFHSDTNVKFWLFISINIIDINGSWNFFFFARTWEWKRCCSYWIFFSISINHKVNPIIVYSSFVSWLSLAFLSKLLLISLIRFWFSRYQKWKSGATFAFLLANNWLWFLSQFSPSSNWHSILFFYIEYSFCFIMNPPLLNRIYWLINDHKIMQKWKVRRAVFFDDWGKLLFLGHCKADSILERKFLISMINVRAIMSYEMVDEIVQCLISMYG